MLMDTLRVDVDLEEPEWRSKPLLRKTGVELPLEHEAASESFLVAEVEGRVRLSDETRLLEEKRLRIKGHKRKRHGGASRGRRHHKSKEATKRKRRLKAWADDPLTRIRFSFKQGVDIREDEWQRLIEPVWSKYSTERRNELRIRVAGRSGDPLHVYNLLLEHGRASGPKKIVYNGPNQQLLDVQNPEYVQRVMELQAIKKPPEGG